jgi:hypothetical protein
MATLAGSYVSGARDLVTTAVIINVYWGGSELLQTLSDKHFNHGAVLSRLSKTRLASSNNLPSCGPQYYD